MRQQGKQAPQNAEETVRDTPVPNGTHANARSIVDRKGRVLQPYCANFSLLPKALQVFDELL